MIYRFEIFSENKIINDCYELTNSLNESFNLDKMEKLWNKIMTKIKNISPNSRKKIISYFVSTALLIGPIGSIIKIGNETEFGEDVVECVEEALHLKGFKNPIEMRLSKGGRSLIKEHEKLRLNAYSIGDGMITIGWGHAEKISNSKFKIGDTITKDKANEMLMEDLTIAANGVRKIFKEWEDSGNPVLLTQDMFDALVSLSYNCGVGGLRKSEVIKELKNKNYELAGNLIKEFKISKKFKGLEKRRNKESELFLSFTINI